MKKILFFLLTIGVSLTCTRLRPSIGKSSEVIVVASHIDQRLFTEAVQIYNYVPQKEGVFNFIFTSDTALGTHQRNHAIVLAGTLQDDFIQTLLNKEARFRTERDTFMLFKKNNIWVDGQIVVVLAVRDREHVDRALAQYGRLISQTLEENYYQRIKRDHYATGISGTIKQRMAKYGLTVDVNEAWLIDSTHQDENFVAVHAHFPDRSLFFYKEKRPAVLDGPFALAKRDSLARRFYAGDYILAELTVSEPIEFAGLKGIRLRGVWQNDSLVAGGPFISYFLGDRDTLYVIDGLVFNPGERKTDHLTRMEVIMNSLRILHP